MLFVVYGKIMKIALTILVVIILAVLACGCTTQVPQTSPVPPTAPANTAIPDVTCVWKGPSVGYIVNEGWINYPATTFNITTQKGQVFIGKKEYESLDGKFFYENFTGMVTSTGEFYQVDSIKGFSIGKLTTPDTLELHYLEEGNNTKSVITHLTRQR
jgi:hypothetical protein